MSSLDDIDDEIRRIADKYADSNNKGALLQELQDMKKKLLENYMWEVDKMYNSLKDKLIKDNL
jgi:hypothetical protein